MDLKCFLVKPKCWVPLHPILPLQVAKNQLIFSPPVLEGQKGVGLHVPPTFRFHQKDTGFERFISIPDDPEILSKKYYVSEKL